jgi:hypothetical protein
MTHISFLTLVPLAETHFDVTTVPRVGDEICLEAPNGALVMFKVKKVTWYVAREPYRGLEAEVDLSLVGRQGGHLLH